MKSQIGGQLDIFFWFRCIDNRINSSIAETACQLYVTGARKISKMIFFLRAEG